MMLKLKEKRDRAEKWKRITLDLKMEKRERDKWEYVKFKALTRRWSHIMRMLAFRAHRMRQYLVFRQNELVFVQNAKSQTPECGIYHHLHTINPCYVLQDFMRLSSLAAAALSGCWRSDAQPKPLTKSCDVLLLLPNKACNNSRIKRRGRKCFCLAEALKELMRTV